MDINDVKKQNLHNTLNSAREKRTQQVTGDTRTYLQKAADAAVGNHSLTAPKFDAIPGQTGTKTGSTTNASSLKMSTPEIPQVGFKPTTPSLPTPTLSTGKNK